MTTTKTDAQTVLEALQRILNEADSLDEPTINEICCQSIAKQALPAAQRLVDGEIIDEIVRLLELSPPTTSEEV
jgi:hypothetical protein